MAGGGYLQWSASQQYTMWCCVVCVQHLCQLAVMVLHAMSFVNDHVLPTNLQQPPPTTMSWHQLQRRTTYKQNQ